MAITTQAGARAGIQWPRYFQKIAVGQFNGRPHSTWYGAGMPPSGSGNSTLDGVSLSSPVTGQLPFTDPVSGNTYLSQLRCGCTNAGLLIIADRLWHNGGFDITSTSPQNITSPTWPARDNNGSVNGEGVFLAVEAETVMGAATPSVTVAYTNSNGDNNRSAADFTVQSAAGPYIGSMVFLGLQSGDLGVQSVQSLTLSTSWLSGTMHLVAYRPIAMLEVGDPTRSNNLDAVTGGFARMYNGSVPFIIWIPAGTSTGNPCGSINWSQG